MVTDDFTAQELLRNKQQTLLNQADHQALITALEAESTPTPALLGAWQLHEHQTVRSQPGGRAEALDAC